jgi:hypothetical protein
MAARKAAQQDRNDDVLSPSSPAEPCLAEQDPHNPVWGWTDDNDAFRLSKTRHGAYANTHPFENLFNFVTVRHLFCGIFDFVFFSKVSLCVSHAVLAVLRVLPIWVHVAIYFFWRLAYNVGLGALLHYQSHYRLMTKFYERHSRDKSSWSYKILR